MDIRYFLLSILLWLSSINNLNAQHRERTLQETLSMPGRYKYEDVYRFSPPSVCHCDISHALKIAESKLHIEYELMVLCDTTKTKRHKDRVVCFIGDEWYWTFGESNWKHNMRYTLPDGHPDEKKYYRTEGCEEIFVSSIYRNIKSRSVIHCGQMPEIKNTIFRYDEKTPAMNWELTGESEDILGYACQKAITRYAGREWTVWFTPEVPVDCGLWKFNGLPGLIMKAQDSKEEYVFSLIGIEQRQEDIVRYPKREKVVTREQYRKTEQLAHDDPILVSRGDDGFMSIIAPHLNLTGKEVFTSGHFLYPYNPMEIY